MDPQKFANLKRQHEQGLVVGLADVAGVFPRLDIDVLLYNEPRTFNLFLLAFSELQGLPSSDPMGFYQIAGIHGFPKVAWQGVAKDEDVNNDSGYCNHSTSTFPTWHRPYLAMLEQALFIKMVEIAGRYNQPYQSDYLAACLRFRLPYWDYYRPRGGQVRFPGIIDNGRQTSAPFDYSVPRILTDQTVNVRVAPDNSIKPGFKNPLAGYDFNTTNGDLRAEEWTVLDEDNNDMINHDITTRHPFDRNQSSTFKWNNPDRLNKVMNEFRMDANRYVLDMIGEDYYMQYDNFASTGVPDPSKDPGNRATQAAQIAWENASGSLEGVHNQYHVFSGGWPVGAHMSRVATAAFDPLFWFHHNNIERYFSIWQAVHASERDTNWFRDSNQAQQELAPFLNPSPSDPSQPFYNSNDVIDTRRFGYTFEDVKGSKNETRQNFEYLYRWSVPIRRTDRWGQCPPQMAPLDLTTTDFFKPAGSSAQTFTSMSLDDDEAMPEPLAQRAETSISPEVKVEDIAPNEEVWSWYIDDKVERLALNGAFTILYFINLQPNTRFDDDQDLTLAPTLAGLTHIFAAPVEGCDNCGRQRDLNVLVSNTVAITSQLIDYIEIGQLQSLHPDHVRPFLVERLRWRVVTANGDRVDPRVLSERKHLRIGISAKMSTGGPLGGTERPEIQDHTDLIVQIIGNASGRAGIVEQQ